MHGAQEITKFHSIPMNNEHRQGVNVSLSEVLTEVHVNRKITAQITTLQNVLLVPPTQNDVYMHDIQKRMEVDKALDENTPSQYQATRAQTINTPDQVHSQVCVDHSIPSVLSYTS